MSNLPQIVIDGLEETDYVSLDVIAPKGDKEFAFTILIPNWDFQGRDEAQSKLNNLILTLTNIEQTEEQTKEALDDVFDWLKETIVGLDNLNIKITEENEQGEQETKTLTCVMNDNIAYTAIFDRLLNKNYIIRGMMRRFVEYFEQN